MTPGAGRVKVNATNGYGPASAAFRFNTAPAKNDLAVVEHLVVTVEAEQIIKEWKNNVMTAKTHVVISEHSGPVVDKSNSGSLVDSVSRQVEASRLAEYIFKTSALANELASNEPSSNKSHAAEEPLATDTVELDPKDAYSTLYNGMKEVRATFSSFDRLAQQVDQS